MLRRRPGWLARAGAALLVALLCATGAASVHANARATAHQQTTRPHAPAPEAGVRAVVRTTRALRRVVRSLVRPFTSPQPNIVFVLTDDLTSDLLPYMPNVRRLQRRGTTFSNYFVTDSLCCPSRASILTGQYPHDTGIFRNTGADGGFLAFHARGLEQDTYATNLQGVGYRTALMGKYLNQYSPGRIRTALGGPYVPPGWTDWTVAGNGYRGFGYRLARTVRVVRHGFRAKDYLTNVLARQALGFASESVAEGAPFMLNVWTFAPHAPAVPAPRDRHRFAGLTAPRDPSFDEADMSDKPAWLRGHRALTDAEQARIDATFRDRVRSVQAVDRMIGRLERRLRALGVARNTYVFFSSDNGFHLGQHRLTPGKLTAYDPDVRVPLVVAGPGVPAGRTVDAMTENTDLCPTFAELAGAPAPPRADGRSLVPLLHGDATARAAAAAGWRDAVLVEHHGNVGGAGDPDAPPAGSGNPPSYEALRSKDELYVEYADGERELYDLASDPFELRNLADQVPPERLARLSAQLAGMASCHGAAQCWAAGHLG
ncbi:MAG: sulfatase [Actinobacteria bacterium]|nr:sulfatase [Actinomycetota bacterium]